MNKKIFFAVAIVLFFSAVLTGRAEDVQNVLQQMDFSSKQSEPWGSYAAAIGIASGTITEFGTTTVGVGDLSAAYLGWECEMRVENNAVPYWCAHYIPLAIATTTSLGPDTHATVFQNPHQAVDGDVELYYVDYYGGQPLLGSGVAANTTPGLSWAWTCGSYCRNGGILGGTSNYFVPYFEMGPQADPPQISLLGQSDGHTDEPLAAHGTANGSIKLNANMFSSVHDPLVMQVEVRDAGTPFSGEPTATSSVFATSGGRATVTVSGIASGEYHWAARAVDTVTEESSPWVSFGSSGVADFVMQTPRDAVIVIPGIMGSRLTRAGTDDEVWPDVLHMLLSPSDDYLDDLALTKNSSEVSGKEMSASSVIDNESVLGISQDFYGNLFAKLEADGYASGTTLFAYPYDWRRGAARAATDLATLVSRAQMASPTGKVSFVAHSFGGLVLKQYLAGLADDSFVSRVILAGVPQLGAPEAFKVLQYGSNLGFQFPIIGTDILNSKEVQQIAQNMPTLYELMPSEKYTVLAGGYVENLQHGNAIFLDHDATTQMMLAVSGSGRNPALFAAADQLHAALDAAPVRAENVYNIIGCSEPTISEFHIYDGGVVDVKRATGDGTVPEASAMNLADGFKNYFVLGSTGITHQALVGNARPVSLITSILDDTAETAPLPDGISRSLGDCVGDSESSANKNTTIELSAHGASGLDVYDAAGNHIGPNASGSIDLGIPGGAYDAIGDNYFVTVPASSTYRATTKESTSSDDLIIRKREYNGGTVSTSTNYIVPSAPSSSTSSVTETTTAQIDIADSGETKLTVTTGDGAVGTPVDPIPTPSDPDDTAPPVIIIPNIASPVLLNSTATLTFDAVDTGSGVAFLRATLDNAIVENGATVTFGTLGTHIFRVLAIDAAGNPAMREISIVVTALSPNPPRQISFVPSEDTFVASDVSNGGNGTSSFLRLRAHGKDRALVQFDTAAMKDVLGSSTIVSAKLVLPVAKNWGNWNGSSTIDLFSMDSPWQENTATWSMTSPSAGTMPSVTTTISNDTADTISFDVTSDAAAWLAGGENNGWIIKKADECAPGVIDLDSRESTSPPRLIIDYF